MASCRSTLQLFEKYTVTLDDGKVDASGVLSKACYEEWLVTRLQPPKNAPEAFRKTITAHCRGDCGMQPFPPEMEAAVLGLLRRKEVWDCFRETKKKIGLRGYQTSGYWEKRKHFRSEEEDEDLITKILHPPLPSKEILDYTPYNAEELISFKLDLPYFLSKIYIENEKLYGRNNMLEYEPPDHHPYQNEGTYAKNLSEEEVGGILDDFNRVVNGTDKQEIFKEGLLAFIKFATRDFTPLFVLKIFRQIGFNVFYPKDLPFKIRMDPNLRYLFSREFCLPKEEFRQFGKDRQTGLILGDPATLTSFDLDDATRDIYRGSILGVTALKLRVNKVQSFMYLKDILKEFMEKGEVWTRSIEHRCDGTIMVLLNRYFRKPSEPYGVFVAIQDVTDQYFNIL